jgi:hypothetical protein
VPFARPVTHSDTGELALYFVAWADLLPDRIDRTLQASEPGFMAAQALHQSADSEFG